MVSSKVDMMFDIIFNAVFGTEERNRRKIKQKVELFGLREICEKQSKNNIVKVFGLNEIKKREFNIVIK